MSRLTQYLAYRDTKPSELTKLWCDHNLTHLDYNKDDIKQLRKEYLKSIRQKKAT
jgi:hypothetical protein